MIAVSRLAKAPFSATFTAPGGTTYPSTLSNVRGLENGWRVSGASVIPPAGETRFRATVHPLTGSGKPTVSVRYPSGMKDSGRAVEHVEGVVNYFVATISSMAAGDTGLIIIESF